jgi:hypothetical protein
LSEEEEMQMEKSSRITVRRLRPRTLGGALLLIALGGESYLMSLHTAAASYQSSVRPQVSVVQTAAVAPKPALPPNLPAIAGTTVLHTVPSTGPTTAPTTTLTPTPATIAVQSEARKPSPLTKPAVALETASAVPAPIGNTANDRAVALKAFEALQLQSILIGDTRRSCVINNVTCEEGEQIDGFTVEVIASASVTVSTGIYRFDLAVSR